MHFRLLYWLNLDKCWALKKCKLNLDLYFALIRHMTFESKCLTHTLVTVVMSFFWPPTFIMLHDFCRSHILVPFPPWLLISLYF